MKQRNFFKICLKNIDNHAIFAFLSLLNLFTSLTRLLFGMVGWLVVVFKANCPLVAPQPIGGMPSVEVILRDPSLYLRECTVR